MKILSFQTFIDGFVIFWALFGLNVVWDSNISIVDQSIPTVINGVTSCTGLVIGFTVTAMTILAREIEIRQHGPRMVFTLLAMVSSTTLLVYAYLKLIDGEYHSAIKIALTGLILAVSILFDFLSFLFSKLSK